MGLSALELDGQLSSITYDQTEDNPSSVLKLLSKIVRVWSNRAQVKKDIQVDSIFDENIDDFLPELLPFAHHPVFEKLPEDLKKKILSCGWIIYNEKTVQIETKIVNPVCVDILSDAIPGNSGNIYRKVLSQTMTDESYHVLLVVTASNITREKRNLDLVLPEFSLVKNMKGLENTYNEEWQKKLIRFATAVVSEIFISDYLKLISESDIIQPLNKMTVAAHRKDELAHKGIFKYLTKSLYHSMSKKERFFFAKILPQPVQWFANNELEVWKNVLKQIGIPKAEFMIQDCHEIAERSALAKIDYSELVALAAEIGITDIPMGFDSFYNAGLLN